jgi:hypothetical protein
MATKEEVQARHGVMNGSSRLHIEPQAPAPSQAASQPDVTPVDPLTSLQAAEHNLDLARVHARQCRAETLAARSSFSKALEGWNRRSRSFGYCLRQ